MSVPRHDHHAWGARFERAAIKDQLFLPATLMAGGGTPLIHYLGPHSHAHPAHYDPLSWIRDTSPSNWWSACSAMRVQLSQYAA